MQDSHDSIWSHQALTFIEFLGVRTVQTLILLMLVLGAWTFLLLLLGFINQAAVITRLGFPGNNSYQQRRYQR